MESPSDSVVSRKIDKLMREGYSRKQAVAIALRQAQRSGRHRKSVRGIKQREV